MSSPLNINQLQPGDVLVYSRSTLINLIIKVKTWSRYTHVEVYGGDGKVYASRNGVGVGRYDFDRSGLVLVVRPPVGSFSIKAATDWFWRNELSKQGYDWLGLLNFTYARFVGKENGRMFCSEFAVRFLRNGGLPVFGRMDADTISPRDFVAHDLFVPVWASDDELKRQFDEVPRG